MRKVSFHSPKKTPTSLKVQNVSQQGLNDMQKNHIANILTAIVPQFACFVFIYVCILYLCVSLFLDQT